jgi:hypothetical protein
VGRGNREKARAQERKRGQEARRAAEQAGWAGAAGPQRAHGRPPAAGRFSFYLFIYFPSFCSFLKTCFSFEFNSNILPEFE